MGERPGYYEAQLTYTLIPLHNLGMLTARQFREAFHFCFLERLLRIADARLFVLKGGVNLRFFFRSPRYSEDMGLDVLASAVSTLRKNGYKILDDPAFRRTLRTFGIVDLEINDPGSAKHTQTTQRFRVRLVTASGERLPSKVEFSRRVAGREQVSDHVESTVVDRIDTEIARRYSRLSFRCQHYSAEAAILQKVLALAGRPATQARDVFDLDILARGGFMQAEQLQQTIGQHDLALAMQNLDSLSFDDYSGQVLEFIEDDDRREYGSAEAWRSMKEQVRNLLSAP